jgi:hypothetical protein
MALEVVPARARVSLAARHAGIGFLIHNLHRQAEGGCIPLVPSCGAPELPSLPKSSAHELVEAFEQVLTRTSLPAEP